MGTLVFIVDSLHSPTRRLGQSMNQSNQIKQLSQFHPLIWCTSRFLLPKQLSQLIIVWTHIRPSVNVTMRTHKGVFNFVELERTDKNTTNKLPQIAIQWYMFSPPVIPTILSVGIQGYHSGIEHMVQYSYCLHLLRWSLSEELSSSDLNMVLYPNRD
jgi:hypothetical protein